MVFSRKPEPAAPAEAPAPQLRRGLGVEKQHLHAVASAGPGQQSVIGNDLSIEGDSITIRCKGSLKVLGNIQADMHSREVEVGREAVINGSISADTVDVFGRVNGVYRWLGASASALGIALGGIVAHEWSVRATYAVGGVIAVLAAVAFARPVLAGLAHERRV